MIVQVAPIAIANIGWKTYIIFAVLNAFVSQPSRVIEEDGADSRCF